MKESSSYKWIVLGNIMIGTFMAVLDSTVVNTGLPVIMGTLGADINVAEWVLPDGCPNASVIKRYISCPYSYLRPVPSCVAVHLPSKS